MYKKPAIVDEIVEYIKKNLKKGYTRESMKWALINQGYSKMEVEKALEKAEREMVQSAPILKAKPEIKYEVIEPQPQMPVQKKWWQVWK